jgi:hypothetical protein
MYEGVMRDGCPDGAGKAVYPDGSEYDWDWKAGRCVNIIERLKYIQKKRELLVSFFF